ncbi:MAG TPA: ABC transporter permease [Verrucomicrobiae bacterium]|nr:ABC transporter permease [Verrucomicrobiae bacterium]
MAQRLIIEAGRSERQYWRDLWRYRELFVFLAWRDILIRYKQTTVGVAWSLLRPFLTMVILSVVMVICGLDGGGAPVPLFVFSAMLPWQFFSTALSESGASLVNNSNLISKVYFPRLVVPASSVITSFVDFLISAGFAALLMLWYWYPIQPQIVFLPFFVLLTFGASFGAGLWVSALMVKYRDFRFIVPFVVQFGLYATPVFKMTGRIPEHWIWHGHDIPARLLYSLNPMVGIVDGFRWSLLGREHAIYWPGFTISLVGVVLLVWTGLWYFRKTERKFADLI